MWAALEEQGERRHPLNILKEERRQEKETEYDDLGQRAGERDIHASRANAPDAVELNGGLEKLVAGGWGEEKGERQKVLELVGWGSRCTAQGCRPKS